ncbi:hypothetical protein JCM10207_000709 [Rhodosporidiobolus poonsookiae]
MFFASAIDEKCKLSDLYGDFFAHVEVDGKPVPVYKVERPNEKRTTCYIEAVEGKEFKVVFTNSRHTEPALAAWLQIDGAENGGLTIERPTTGTYEGKRVSPTAIRPFTFSKLNTTDDASLATTDENAVKNLGTIQLELYRVDVLGTVVASGGYGDAKRQVFDERSKKATLSHQAGYGAERVKVDSGSRTSLRYIDPYRSPWRVLEFKYRSRMLLELEDIVEGVSLVLPFLSDSPADPQSASSGKKKRAAISLSPDSDEDLRAKVARLEKDLADARRVKAEPGPKCEPIGKVTKENGRVVIDLLDEDDD